MHRSRFCAFVIDYKGGDIDAATRFWSGAMGRPAKPADADSPNYRGLETGKGEPMMLVQRVDHDPRVHLDIETNDVEAEATRLEALGAVRVAKVKTWWVMEAPTGHRFCVVRPQRGELGDDANEWP